MDTIIKIIKNKNTIACFGGNHMAYDNWLPCAVLDLLKSINLETLEYDESIIPNYVAKLEANEIPECEDDECSIIDLDNKAIRLWKGIFQIMAPEKVIEEESYEVIKSGSDYILRLLDRRKGEPQTMKMEPYAMKFLEEKMTLEFGLDIAKDVLTSMLEDAENLKYPTLLQNNLVYVRNVM